MDCGSATCRLIASSWTSCTRFAK